MLYHFLKFVIGIYYKIAFSFRLVGLENIPKEGAAVLCCNHRSNYDPVTVSVFLDRMPRFIAKKELFSVPVVKQILVNLGSFPVDREATMDMKAVRQAVKVLKEGDLLGVFAEGTRVKDGEKADAKGGVALFALKGDAPIIPIAISGRYGFRQKLTMTVGKPIYLDEYKGKKLSAAMLEEIADKTMQTIYEMRDQAQ